MNNVRIERDSSWPTWSRRVIGLSLAALLIVVAVVVAVLDLDQRRSPGHAASPPSPSSSASPSPSAARNATVRTGPGLTEPGVMMKFSPRADGGFDVAEQVILRTPVSRVVFTPPSRKAAGTAFAKTHARIVDLQIQGDESQPLGRRIPANGITRAASVPLGGVTTTLLLRYRLTGTSVRSIPSRAGRALAYVRPITVGFDTTLPVQIVASGTGTLNLTCPALAADQQACAAGSVPHLRTRSPLPDDDSTVVVQVDIPEP